MAKKKRETTRQTDKRERVIDVDAPAVEDNPEPPTRNWANTHIFELPGFAHGFSIERLKLFDTFSVFQHCVHANTYYVQLRCWDERSGEGCMTWSSDHDVETREEAEEIKAGLVILLNGILDARGGLYARSE